MPAEEKHVFNNPNYWVRISVSFDGGGPIDRVLYWKYDIPLDMLHRYLWYWEYLAARVKVKHPRRDVYCETGHCNEPCGQDYIDRQLPIRLKAKQKQLKGLLNPDKYDDLFGFISEEKRKKAEKVEAEIKELEQGIYNAYVPPTYINLIKNWI